MIESTYDEEIESWILALFNSAGGIPIIGKTMLMKQIFILAYEINPELKEKLEFFAGKYGPYSNVVADFINELKRQGKITGAKVGRDIKYEITGLGRKSLEESEKSFDPDIMKKLDVMKEATQQWGLRKLLHYVYTRYPEYTPYSRIRGTILG